jgi:hypothetical protein
MEIDGIAVRLGLRYSETEMMVAKVEEWGGLSWTPIDPMEGAPATLKISHEFGRALLDALLRHYQGSGDYHQLRKDYEHEQGRVDRLITVVSDSLDKMIDQFDA